MGREQEAFQDLIQSLEALPWLSVYTEKGKAGGMSWGLEVYRGPQTFTHQFGCRKVMNGYSLTLKTPGTTAPDELSAKLGVIDDTITADRRRGGTAQSTIMAEDGWTPDEDEGREAFSISTTLVIYIHEVN